MAYHGRNIGRLIHFLTEYCGSKIAHDVQFGENYRITLHNRLFATYTWEDTFGCKDVPVFVFESPKQNITNKTNLNVRKKHSKQVWKRRLI